MKYYVYVYIDPTDLKPFYIGKGCNKRWQAHLNETVDTTINERKYRKLQKILRSGQQPIIRLVHTGLEENEAIRIEEELILFFGRREIEPQGCLMNIALGVNPPNPWLLDGAEKRRDEFRKRMKGNALQNRQGCKFSKERKKEISDQRKGSGNPMYGKKQTAKYYEGRKKVQGENCYLAKMTEQAVRIIKASAQTYKTTPIGHRGKILNAWCKEYGVAQGTIQDIIAGRTWKHLDTTS